MDLSQARSRLNQLKDELVNLIPLFLKRRKLIKGGVYENKTKCGKGNCKCKMEGKLHLTWRIYWSEGGKTKVKAIKKGKYYEYKELTANYKRFREARAKLVKIQKEMIKIIDYIEKGLTKRNIKDFIKEVE